MFDAARRSARAVLGFLFAAVVIGVVASSATDAPRRRRKRAARSRAASSTRAAPRCPAPPSKSSTSPPASSRRPPPMTRAAIASRFSFPATTASRSSLDGFSKFVSDTDRGPRRGPAHRRRDAEGRRADRRSHGDGRRGDRRSHAPRSSDRWSMRAGLPSCRFAKAARWSW